MKWFGAKAVVGARKIVTKFLWLPTCFPVGECFETRWLCYADIWYKFVVSQGDCYWEADSWAN